MTTMPAFRAKKLDVPIPKRPMSGLILYGQEVRSGFLRARVVDMDPTEFVFPCYFLGDPNLTPHTRALNLLGLTGVINQVRLIFDGTKSAGAVGSVGGREEIAAMRKLDHVPKVGLEPTPPLQGPDFESGASAIPPLRLAYLQSASSRSERLSTPSRSGSGPMVPSLFVDRTSPVSDSQDTWKRK